MDEKRQRRLKFLIDAAFYLVVGIITFFVIKYTLLWALPFIIAFVSAFLLNPIISFLKRKLKIPRFISSIVLVLAFFTLLCFLAFGIIAYLLQQFNYLSNDLPSLKAAIEQFFNGLSGQFNNILNILPADYAKMLGDSISESLQSSSGIINNISLFLLNTLKGWALSLPAVLIFIIASIISSVFVCSGFENIKKFIVWQLPEKSRKILFEVKSHLSTSVFGFLRAYLTLLCITFLELSVGFSIIGIKYAIILALLVALVDILPVLGVGTVLIPWALVSLALGNYRIAISIILLYIILTAVRQILEPKIIGQQIGVHPLITLMCIYAGFKALGFAGMFAFPIVFIILKRLQEDGYIHLWKTPKNQIDDTTK